MTPANISADRPADVRAFQIELADSEIEDLRRRLRDTRWPDRETVTDWSQGVPLGYLQDLAAYWRDEYDMARVANRLNAFPQYHTAIDGVEIHFLHVRSPHEDAMPLILTHGWPGSVLEFLACIGPLTDPTAHGGDVCDAFHVVVPSLPGHGFSGKPTAPGWGISRIADAWVELMSRLGYGRFLAQGGDWGSVVTTTLGFRAPEQVLGIHLNCGIASPEALLELGDLTDLDRLGLADLESFQRTEMGYFALQSTRPQTVGYALTDSPVGQLAWIVEKFRQWSDCDGHPENAVSRDEILDGVTLYWVTGTGTSSARLYWEEHGSLFDGLTPTKVPVAFTMFPRETVRLSERWARTRFPDLRYHHQASAGGHFAALEQPEIFVGELRAGFRAIRGEVQPVDGA